MKLALVLLISLLSVVLARPGDDGLGKNILNSIKNNLKKARDWTSHIWNKTENWFKDKRDKAKAWISDKISDAKGWFKSVKESIVKFYHAKIEPFYNDIVDIFNVIKDAYKYIKERIESGFNKQQRAEVGQKLADVFNYIVAKTDTYFYAGLNHIETFIIEYTTRLGNQIVEYLAKPISQKCQNDLVTDYKLYNESFDPKLKDCVTEVKDEVVTAYNTTKDLFLGIPTTITDIVEDIASCYEAKKAKSSSCVKEAGISVMMSAVGFVTDFISVKVIITSAADKVAGARACIKDAARDAAIEQLIIKHRNQLKTHLKECGLKAAADILEFMSS